jgi:hypothetical protein
MCSCSLIVVHSGDVIPIVRRPIPCELQTTSVSDPPVRNQGSQNDESQWPPPHETQDHQNQTHLSARRVLKARILLKADVSEDGKGWSDNRIIEDK